MNVLYVQVTVHRDNLCINKQQDASSIQNFVLSRNCTCFGNLLCPSSGVASLALHTNPWPIYSNILQLHGALIIVSFHITFSELLAKSRSKIQGSVYYYKRLSQISKAIVSFVISGLVN